MRSLCVVVVISVMGVGPAHAQADKGVAAAKRWFKQAEEHFAAGRYRAALDSYQSAYRAKPLPGFLFNIGQCYQNLKQYQEAVDHFERFIKQTKDPQHKADAQKLIDFCNGKLTERKLENMQEEAPPPYKPSESSVSEEKQDAALAPEPEDPRGMRRLHPAFLYTGIAVTAALLITGTITGGIALDKSRQFKDETTPLSELGDLRDSGESMRSASSASFGVAVACGAVTGLLYFFTDFSPRESTVTAGPLTDGGAVVTMGGRF